MAAGLVQRVFVASPRGYCAGVERAVETVEHALALYGAPVYVRKQIVHNAHVVDDLERRGAIFVEDETDAPAGAILVLSAHGVAPTVFDRAAARHQTTIDATCPLVTKVHVQARRYAAEGRRIVLIGHAGHEEVVGTMGEAPEAILLVENVEDAEALDLPVDTPLAYITQTTLSVDETAEIIQVLKRRFPQIHAPQREDICYATSNRQWAVKEMLDQIELLLVIGSRNSSNSNRLVERPGARLARRRRRPDSACLTRHGADMEPAVFNVASWVIDQGQEFVTANLNRDARVSALAGAVVGLPLTCRGRRPGALIAIDRAAGAARPAPGARIPPGDLRLARAGGGRARQRAAAEARRGAVGHRRPDAASTTRGI